MKDAGYTLSETLIAMAMLSLVIAGLTAAVQVLARQQRAVDQTIATTSALRTAQASLDRLFDGAGPFRSQDSGRFVGAAAQFQFNCGQEQDCAVQLVDGGEDLNLQIQDHGQQRTLGLRTKGPAHFDYQGTLGPSAVWPPSNSQYQALRAISLIQDGGGTYDVLLKTRLWIEQSVTCAFDVVQQDCR